MHEIFTFRAIFIINTFKMICKICNEMFSTSNMLSRHISKVHNISKQEYYDKYLKTDTDGICLNCGKHTKFKNITSGYFKYCCVKCAQNDKTTIEKREHTTMQKYGSKNIRNSDHYVKKTKLTKIARYNDENYNNRSKAKETCLKKYGVENPFQSDEVKNKIKQTNLVKYGVENILKLNSTIEKIKSTNLQRYGYEWPQQNPDIRKKQQYKYTFDNKKFDSSWELTYYIWLKDNNIQFEYQPNVHFSYMFNNKQHIYCPDFLVNNEFVEVKGLQFFEDCNPSHKMINPYDKSQDELYEAKHQCMLTNNVKILTNIDKYENYVIEKYTNDFIKLFKNNLEFPYLNSDLANTSDMGIIQHFHKSVYDAHRENKLSPIEAWNDKNLIYKCALNRLKYVGHCKPNDILQGFNVTKIAPKVSVFKPELAKRLIAQYLQQYSIIVDPFSGFSGRMLGANACKKKYIGYDINELHVAESQEIIDYKHIVNVDMSVENLLLAPARTYENAALFTCPPYNGKEHWNNDEVEKSCDEWIDLCIEKHKCDKYLFVVDKTKKYENCIIETLTNKSHFSTSNEYIVII